MTIFDGLSKTGLKLKNFMDEAESLKVPTIDSGQASLIGVEMNQLREMKQQAREEREIELNNMIEQIVENTSFLPEMVGLIRKNNEVNEEILELFKEVNNVLKAQTKEEAENIVLGVVEKAKYTKDALDTMTSLVNYGKVLIKLMFPDS